MKILFRFLLVMFYITLIPFAMMTIILSFPVWLFTGRSVFNLTNKYFDVVNSYLLSNI